MVFDKRDGESIENEEEIEITKEQTDESEEMELVDEEEKSNDKIKKIRKKLQRCEEEKKQLQDDLQRERAEFLNARKRLDEERRQDKLRHKKEHIQELLPLCDSFQMAMSNKEVWEKADENWRKGIEGIHAQLQKILSDYGVKVINPVGEAFDPYRDEAVGTEEVEDEKMVDKVVSVVQLGYEIDDDGRPEVIRHARVVTGVKKKK